MAESNEQSIALSVQESQNESQGNIADFVSVKSPGESSWEVVGSSQEDGSEIEPDTKSVVPQPVVHQHVHHHVNVRKTVLKDCGNHFHVNRSKKRFITHVHHHHYLTIQHFHVYGHTGVERPEFSTSTLLRSEYCADVTNSASRSSPPEPRSISSDSQ